MAIYSSKNALATVGTNETVYDSGNFINPPLKSKLFENNALLQKFNRLPLSTELYKGNDPNQSSEQKEAIRLIKLGFNILIHNEILDLGNSNIGYLNEDSAVLDDSTTEEVIIAFQTAYNVNITGLLTPLTLFKLDRAINEIDYNLQFDVYSDGRTQYIGKFAGSALNFRFQNDQAYVYFVDAPTTGAPLNLSAENVRKLKVIIKYENQNPSTDMIPFELNEEFFKLARENNNDSIRLGYLKNEDIKVLKADGTEVEPTKENIENEINNIGIPPNPLGDQATLYVVKPDDDFVKIVTDHYYDEPAEPLINPYADGSPDPYYTFPSRSNQQSPVANRHEDARLKYYLNLIYYYNSKETGGSGIEEYGIKANGSYQRHDPNDLDAYYIFDNEYNSNVPDTALPNYYKFLNYESGNNSSIEFDQNGKTTSFNTQTGKYVWIPSRQFADSMYYHLNFRQNEMLQNIGDAAVDYVDDIEDFIGDVTDVASTAFHALSSWAQDEVVTLYHETLDYFKKCYNYLVNQLAKYWPRSAGGHLGVEAGVTWGLPVSVDIAGKFSIWRKLTNDKDFILKLKQELIVGIGFDVTTGVNAGLRSGFNSGSGHSGSSFGFKAGAGITGGGKFKLNIEYEFPVRPNETGLIAAIIAATGNAELLLGAKILRHYNVINIDPMSYMTKTSMGLEFEGDGWAKAQLAFESNGSLDGSKTIQKSETSEPSSQQIQRKSFLQPNNIFSKLPGLVGGGGSGVDFNLNIGCDFTIEMEYADDSLLPDVFNRIPKQVKLSLKFYGKGHINIGAVGAMIARFFLCDVAAVGSVFTNLNFDKGYALSLIYEYNRSETAAQLSLSDVDISGADAATSIADTNSHMKFLGTGWETYIKLGTYSGEVDDLCGSGMESMIKLNAYALYNVFKTNSSFSTTSISDILSIFYSYSFRFKISLGEGKKSKSKLGNSVANRLTNVANTGVDIYTREIIKEGRKSHVGISFGLALDVELEFIFEELITKVIKFYMQFYYLVFEVGITSEQKSQINDEKSNFAKALLGQSSPTIQYFNDLYDHMNTWLVDTNLNPTHNFQQQLDNVSYDKEFGANLSIFTQFIQYLNGNPASLTEMAALGVAEIFKILVYAIEIAEKTVSLEALLGVAGSGNVKAGEGATVRVAIGGELALMSHAQIVEKNVYPELDTDDPLYGLIHALKTNLNETVSPTGAHPQEDGLHKTLENIQSIAKVK